ncbi:hypothetical protein CXB51_016475 [Gossypium anomalum]|uniref:Reverse transcriptase domain-containing protein n=1 Tax=Gossypium anomalum TaxID=47600 RepID=A0A8J5YE07_9ROSI|nr:hypothetical protein CXB51_016475 [Gossypium anomalum]
MIKDLIQLLQKRIESIAREPAAPGQDFFSHLAQREKEIQKLQAQIKELQETGKIPEPVKRPETIELFPSVRNEPSFKSEERKKKEKEAKKDRDREKLEKFEESEDQAYQEEKKLGKRPIIEESPPQSPPKQVSKSLMIQEKEDKNPITTFLKNCHESTIPKISAVQIHDPLESETESSSPTSEESTSTDNEPDNMPEIHVTTKVELSDEEMDEPESSAARTTNHSQKTSGGRNFTIDDLPPEKWPARLQEFHSWLETRKLNEESNYNVLMEFVSRFTGMLRDWWNSINQHDQMQFLVLQNLSEPIRILHEHFIGNPEDLLVLRRREFYARKCCSFKKKDLRRHLKKMFQLFCALGLHPNLKLVILSSLPEETICAIPVYDSDESQISDYDEIYMFQAQAQAQLDQQVLAPHVPVKVYLDKYNKPITVIAFVDTGSAESITNPDILPEEWWKPHTRIFSAADGNLFSTNLISYPITVQIFPGCSVRTTVLGSKLPGKDLIIGFDLYTKIKSLRILLDGIKFKTFFQPFVHIPKLFSLQSEKTFQIIQEIREKSCANSHSEFLTKCPNLLWKNPDFFINLPFKKNEDINPIKASHTGMNPEHLLLAEQECKELQQQDLIEPSNSQWACEAFYVNKRSEQIRGKLRLVINYQPLNHFLQDNKFPLPNNNTFFASLAKARNFSKFDLKAGFWQLGVHPEDRGKTGFCIPNHHFQWKVMPFGLKTAPSLFQKAMTRIFQPIMENALVYIDDILLYSQDEESHV